MMRIWYGNNITEDYNRFIATLSPYRLREHLNEKFL